MSLKGWITFKHTKCAFCNCWSFSVFIVTDALVDNIKTYKMCFSCNCWSFSVFIVTDAKTGGCTIYKRISVVNPLWWTIIQKKTRKKWRKNCRKMPDDAGHHHSRTTTETVIMSDNKADKRWKLCCNFWDRRKIIFNWLIGKRFFDVKIVNNKQMRPSTCPITWSIVRLSHLNTRARNDKQSTNSTIAFIFL